MDKQPSLKVIQRAEKIRTVMMRTGCTKKQARAELTAENWVTHNAIVNVRDARNA